MSHQREHWFVSRLGTLSQRYISSHVTLAFDQYLNLVRTHCPTERHLVEFLKSTMTLEELLGRQCLGRYPTWQEASAVAVAAGIMTVTEYRKQYREIDPRLPSDPNRQYSDFPDWYTFLGREVPERYPTWQEASEVCVAAGVKNQREYKQRYKEIDPRLPSNPDKRYPDFPNWLVFLCASKYPTWQEASAVAIAAGIRGQVQYHERYKEVDPRLPAAPNRLYSDFPGWPVFLGKRKAGLYPTWQEASAVVMAAGVKSRADYRKRSSELDTRLPASPLEKYPDFPGWTTFLGQRKSEFYPTWQEASEVCVAAGVKNQQEYHRRYKEIDPRLPSNPNLYYSDFPSWPEFLGTWKYSTWQEASNVAIMAGVKTPREYKERYKEIDPRLPSSPNKIYSDFPDWYTFLGQEAAELYPSWQEASKIAIAGGVTTSTEYHRRYKEIDPRLPSNPNLYYSDFPSWPEFLGTWKYSTWQEASKVCIEAGIKTGREYYRRSREVDPQLPSEPRQYYSDFPGWYRFLGREVPDLYSTWQEASNVAIMAGVKTPREYKERYKEIDPRLPSNPYVKYPNFPGWRIFLGKQAP